MKKSKVKRFVIRKSYVQEIKFAAYRIDSGGREIDDSYSDGDAVRITLDNNLQLLKDKICKANKGCVIKFINLISSEKR